MSQNLKRVPAQAIIDRIEQQLTGYDRQPFMGILATYLGCAPSRTAVQRWAKQNPGKFARAIVDLGKVAGFADRKEVINVKPEPAEVATALVARYGRDKAIAMLEPHGLAHLVGDVVEGELVQTA